MSFNIIYAIWLIILINIIKSDSDDKIFSSIRSKLRLKTSKELKNDLNKLEQYINPSSIDFFLLTTDSINNTKNDKDKLIEMMIKAIENNHELLKDSKIFDLKDIEKNLYDMLSKNDRDTLEQWTLSCEKYQREKTNMQNQLGGIHDYINKLTNKELIEFIIPIAIKYNLDESKLKQLTIKYEFTTKSTELTKSSLLEIIKNLDRITLEQWAFAVEHYDRQQKGIKVLGGGLHDYINRLSDREIREYIDFIGGQYDDIIFYIQEIIDELGFDKDSDLTDMNVKTSSNSTILIEVKNEDFYEYLLKANRTSLEKYAIAADRFKNENTSITDSTLKDIVSTLNNQQLIQILTSIKNKYNELSIEVLDKIIKSESEKYKSNDLIKLNNYSDKNYTIFSQIVEKQDLAILRKWTLIADSYVSEHYKIITKLEGFITLLSNIELINYIKEITGKYPEVIKLLDSNQIYLEQSKISQSSNYLINYTSSDLLKKLDEKTLKKWALACDKYWRQLNNLNIRKGIHDKIKFMSDVEIAEYILTKVKILPVLTTEFITSMISDDGFHH